MSGVRGRKRKDLRKSWVRIGARRYFGLIGLALCILVRLIDAQAQSVDGFDPNLGTRVQALTLTADGGMTLVLAHTNEFGSAASRLVHLTAAGVPDPGLMLAANRVIQAVASRPDGGYLVGGDFSTLGTSSRMRFASILPNGSVDESVQSSFNRFVSCIALQPDGKILVGGDFTTANGQTRYRLVRLGPDGSLDPGFYAEATAVVSSIVIQPDGRILVAGSFLGINNIYRRRVARLNADGSLDMGFDPGIEGIGTMQLLPDGRIYIGGSFFSIAGEVRRGLARLHPDGSLDTTFTPNMFGSVASLVLQANGELLAAGGFSSIGGVDVSGFAKVDQTGTLIAGFDVAHDGQIQRVAMQEDGAIVLAGDFSTMGGQSRQGLARLTNPVPATSGLEATASTVTLTRGGAAPGLSWLKLSHSPDGTNWNDGGAGTRLATGWEWTGISLPAGGTLRVYGQGATSWGNTAGWEASMGKGEPALITSPADSLRYSGESASFRVVAAGEGPLSFRWYHDGNLMEDDGRVSGATTSTLVLSNVTGFDAGEYQVTVENGMGSIQSEAAVLNVIDPWIAEELVEQFSEVEEDVTFTIGSVSGEPAEFHWLRNGIPVSVTAGPSLVLSSVSVSDAGMYSVVVSNQFGTAVSAEASLKVNAARLDQAFHADANGYVEALAIQADGKILVGGTFTTIGGVSRRHVARLLPDGTVDSGFQVTPAPTSIAPYVNTIAIQDDGRILVGGRFESLDGISRGRVARLIATGTVDPTFSTFADDWVFAVLPDPGNKVIIGGVFSTVNGANRDCIARLNEDGSLDETFIASSAEWVQTLARQADGKILVGGDFNWMTSQFRSRIARLNPDGSLDHSFNPGADGLVRVFSVQADGRILVGGDFSTLGGEARAGIGRLNDDGTVDPSFDPGVNGSVETLAIQADGRILVGGRFTELGGQSRFKLGRLLPDGTVDPSLNPNIHPSSWVTGVALQPDGAILVGGNFQSISGGTRQGFARLNNTEPFLDQLTQAGGTIAWTRQGSGPEVLSSTFSHSADGVTWQELGTGTRVANGWELTGLTVPVGGTLRASGRVSGGRDGMASWALMNVVGAPAIVSHPEPVELSFTGTGNFSVIARGDGGFEYQWYKDGSPLSDGGNFTGTTTPTLVITNAQGAERGSYHVVVQSGAGTATSVGVPLVVHDPIIVQELANVTGVPGGEAMLEGSALGTGPIDYHWLREGIPVAQSSEPRLVLSQLTVAEAGYYQMIASNSFGIATSAPALLTVNGILPDPSFVPAPNDEVSVMALLDDRRIVIGGKFTKVADQPRERLARLFPDGSLDPDFETAADGDVRTIVIQPDGDILLAGLFDEINGQPRAGLARIREDGTLDEAFNPGANGDIESLVLQPDGKILVGGHFTTLAGIARSRIGRLHADGSIDVDFNPSASGGTFPSVYTLLLQPDGRIVVGGGFTSLAGQGRSRIARLNTDGSLDTTFNPGADGSVHMLQPQTDGSILVAGAFDVIGGVNRSHLARLRPNGAVDPGFMASLSIGSSSPYSLVQQADGGILVSGAFNYAGTIPRRGVARLFANGSLDGTFDPDFSYNQFGNVESILLQPDGNILVGGGVKSVEGTNSPYLARLRNLTAAVSQVVADDTSVRWFRSGPAPEVENAMFEFSDDGVTWSTLGQATRMISGWELTNLGNVPEGQFRVRGQVRGDNLSGQSSWNLEARSGGRWYYWPPADATIEYGGELILSAFSEGLSPATYQWFHNGQVVADDGRISGSQSSRLRVTEVSGFDSGSYHVVVTGPDGDSSSPAAQVTVLDPMIVVPPADQFGELGQGVTLSATAAGTGPLGFRWYHDDVFVTETAGPELELESLAGTDSGAYRVEVTNQFGNALSAAGLLTVRVTLPNELAIQHADQVVGSLAVQLDGKILIAGRLTSINGVTQTAIARIWPDGPPDQSFEAAPIVGESAAILTVGLLSNGDVLIGGDYWEIGGRAQAALALLRPDGSLVESFHPGFDFGSVYSMAIQPDGKIVVGGFLPSLEGVGVSNIVRLLPSGARDITFQSGANGFLYALALQVDGKIIAGGDFTSISGQPRERIARLLPDGSVDQTFAAATDNRVTSILVQPDGKTLLAGSFTAVNGLDRGHVARLNPDGTLDVAFHPNVRSDVPFYGATALMLQADGRIVVGGAISSVAGTPRTRLARLHADGSLDESFSPEPDDLVSAITALASGKILVGGQFSTIGGIPRGRLAAFDNPQSPVHLLRHDLSAITWERSGGGPELSRVQFESSDNGTDWTLLGSGEWTVAGWRLSGVSPPTRGALRARGWVTARQFSWILDEYLALGDFSDHDFALTLEVHDGESLIHLGGEPGIPYQLEHASEVDDASPDWTALPAFVPTNGQHTIYLPFNVRSGQRFFRARVVQ